MVCTLFKSTLYDVALIYYIQIGLSTSDAIDALKKAKLISIANQV